MEIHCNFSLQFLVLPASRRNFLPSTSNKYIEPVTVQAAPRNLILTKVVFSFVPLRF